MTEVGIKKYFKKILHRESCTEVKGKKGVTKEILKLGINEKHILLMDVSNMGFIRDLSIAYRIQSAILSANRTTFYK